MKYYQLTYLISPELKEEEVKVFQEKIKFFVQEEGGVLEEVNFPVKIKLGYPIKSKGAAFFGVSNFHLIPQKLEGLKKRLSSESQILRYQIFAEKELRKIPAKIRPSKIFSEKISEGKKKVELKEIEKKLEEILGE